ncbi:MAG TPA: phosphate/phosphonate ABC transporter permease [Planctomycetota bacterium]|nr:phosphate/phosphonate ABC transporter permease [Planctomycetota bacterium]
MAFPEPSSPLPSNVSGRLPDVAPAELRWYERLNTLNVTLAIFVLLAILSAGVLKGSGRDVAVMDRISSLLDAMYPPDLSVWKDASGALAETARIAVWATLFGFAISFPLAMAASSNVSPRWLVFVTRLAMCSLRTIPSIIWAMVGVAIVGPNALAGVIGLTMYSVGYLVKFFSDAFESMDDKIADGLKGMGASSFQAFMHGTLPHAKPLIWSSTLFMLEYNLRSGTIIGFVGAGGIGVLLHSYWEYGQLDRFATVMLVLLAPVVTLDLLGNWARGRITRRVAVKS